MNKQTREDFFRKICTSHFIVRVRKGLLRVLLWEGVGDWTKTAIYWPPLLWPSALCLYCSPVLLNQRPGGSAFCWLSLPQLVTNSSGPQLTGGSRGPLLLGSGFPTTSCLQLVWSPTRLTSCPHRVIVQSPTQSLTQSLEWHVWSSSSRNNCHAVQRSLSSGASVYECIMGFYLVPFRQPNPPMQFLSITGHWNVSLPSSASLWNCMFGQVEGQYSTSLSLSLSLSLMGISRDKM